MIRLLARYFWAKVRGDTVSALLIQGQLLMADLTAFNAALADVKTKVATDAALIATLQAADAVVQTAVDQATADLRTIAPAQ